MGLKADLEALQKQIKPKTSVRFVFSTTDIKPAQGVIYVIYSKQDK